MAEEGKPSAGDDKMNDAAPDEEGDGPVDGMESTNIIMEFCRKHCYFMLRLFNMGPVGIEHIINVYSVLKWLIDIEFFKIHAA